MKKYLSKKQLNNEIMTLEQKVHQNDVKLMTLEQKVHQNDVKLRKAEERIKQLENAVAKLVVIETNRVREIELDEARQRQIDEDTADIGSDL